MTKTHQIPGGSRVFLFLCEGCGSPAMFGTGVNLREAMRTGDVSKCGHWYCGRTNGVPACVRRLI